MPTTNTKKCPSCKAPGCSPSVEHYYPAGQHCLMLTCDMCNAIIAVIPYVQPK